MYWPRALEDKWNGDCCAQGLSQGFWKEEHLQSAYFGQNQVYLLYRKIDR